MRPTQTWGIVILGLLMSGCMATYDGPSDVHIYTNNDEPVGAPAIKTPNLVADLDIERKRFSHTIRGSQSVPESFIRRTALSEALLKGRADIIVDPIFHIVIKPRGYEATVTGYLARYKSMRMVSSQDLRLLKAAAGHPVKKPKASSIVPAIISTDKE